MVAVDIPYFKEVIIMATNCDQCGYRSNEVKGQIANSNEVLTDAAGGAISSKGKKLTLNIKTAEDMTRNILKSETATGIVAILLFPFDLVLSDSSWHRFRGDPRYSWGSVYYCGRSLDWNQRRFGTHTVHLG